MATSKAKPAQKKRKLGKYTIQSQIGKGSAANIYLAEQEGLGRKVVVKELLPVHTSNDKIIGRFKREARVVSQLAHDAIVHVYDAWVRGNSYYISMEYVHGKTLREILLRDRFLPVKIAAVIVYQICRGLAHAHARGVVHRDLKPSNIMLSDIGQVKLLDFGIAHFQYDENLTSVGAVIGTYSYMSPEQALGKKISPASDIFSLGILFYELLAGVKPFVSDEHGEVLDKIVHKRAIPVGRLNPAVPRCFSAIVRRCLRKKPGRRYEDVTAVQTRLEKVLKRYSLDHQSLLRNYLENPVPRKVDSKWPPGFWKRQVYRATHGRPRTYIVIAIFVVLCGIIEYVLYARGIGLSEQVRRAGRAGKRIWTDLFVRSRPVMPDSATE